MTVSSAPQLLPSAIAAHRAGRLAEAERTYRTVLALDPRNIQALHFLGILRNQLGDLPGAVELIRKASTLIPRSADLHADLGELLRRSGDLDEAAREFTATLSLDPRHVAARRNLGLTRLAQSRHGEAAACFAQVIGPGPGSADDWHGLGLARQGEGNLRAAIDAYRTSLGLAPGRVDTLVALSGALLDGGEGAAAITASEDALKHAPNHVPALRALAAALAERTPDRAIDVIEHALTLAPANADLLELLASTHRRAGAFDEAWQGYSAALALPGQHAVAYYGLSLCRRFTPWDEQLIDAMAEALNAPGTGDRERSFLRFALGKVCDDLGRYEEAIGHFDTANRLWLDSRTPDRRKISLATLRSANTARIDGLIRHFDAARIDHLRAPGDPSERPVFIVGMRRSGTTLVEQILASHRDVVAGGEQQFWPSVMARLEVDNWALSDQAAVTITRDYLALLSAISAEACRVTDKMPQNILAAGLISGLFPNARIIHCRRHPLDVALSIYFTQFVGDEPFCYDRASIVAYYEDYLRLAAHWRLALPADRFMEVDYEDLVAEQEQVSRAIVAFCRLEWDNACLKFHDTDRPIHTASAWQARQPIYVSSRQRWRHYERWLGEFAALRNLSPT